jgi:polysaccharide deacetylase 2 family uncharacterized protein YibQ
MKNNVIINKLLFWSTKIALIILAIILISQGYYVHNKLKEKAIITDQIASVDIDNNSLINKKNIKNNVAKALNSKRDEITPAKITSESVSITADNVPNTAQISFLLLNLGLSETATEKAIKMPAIVGIGVSTYSYKIEQTVDTAVRFGHEVYVSLPLEPHDYPIDNAGPLALMTKNSLNNNMENFKQIIGRSGQIKGLYSFGTEQFTTSANSMMPFLKEMTQNNLYYIFTPSIMPNQIIKAAENNKILHNAVFLDSNLSSKGVKERIALLEQIALKNGKAFAVSRSYPIVMDEIVKYISDTSRQTSVVPISMLLDNNKKEEKK